MVRVRETQRRRSHSPGQPTAAKVQWKTDTTAAGTARNQGTCSAERMVRGSGRIMCTLKRSDGVVRCNREDGSCMSERMGFYEKWSFWGVEFGMGAECERGVG